MKSIVVALTIGGNKQNAILKTNDDGKSSKFTIMQVEKPAGLTDNDFPFRYGQVLDIQEVINILAVLNTTGVLSIDSVSIEDANTKGSLSLDDAPIFEFELYDNTDTKTGEGKLFMPGRQYIAYDEIEFLTNTDTSNVGTSYLIPNSATPDGETLYELYNFSYAPVGLKVKIMAKPAPPVPVPAKITITENGTDIDVSEYELADVDVPQPSGNINITQNGEDIDIAQYATANVNVEAAGCPIYAVRFTAVDSSDDYDITIPVGVLKNGVLPPPRVFDISKTVTISVYCDPSVVENIDNLRVCRTHDDMGSQLLVTFSSSDTPTYVTIGGKQIAVYSKNKRLQDVTYFQEFFLSYMNTIYIDFLVP